MLLVYTALIRLNTLLNPVGYSASEDDTLLTKWIMSVFESPLSQSIVALFLVYLQAVFINRVVIKHKLANEITLLPGLIYILFVSFLPGYLSLSPYLITNTFVIISLNEMFKTYRRPKAANIIFNVGLCLGFSAIFVPEFIFLIPFVYICLYMMRSMGLKDFLQFIFGTIAVLFLYSGIAFLNDSSPFDLAKSLNLGLPLDVFSINKFGLYKLIGILLLIIFAIFNYRNYTFKKSIQAQRKVDILFWMLFSFGILFMISGTIISEMVVLIFVPLAIFYNINFNNIKNPLIQESIHIVVILLLVLIHYNIL